jgi:histone-lysine N-methyltransferase SUV420H
MDELQKLQCLKNHMSKLRTPIELEHFRKHLEKYILLYLPDCPFEVTTTNRYTIYTHEACVTARRPIKTGEKIKYLTGHQVAMNKDEEHQLELTQRNFSIVFSSRKKTQSLFLGPARFANHDCNANARLTPVGAFGMEIVAIRTINIDEEITVSYGDDYFGEDNCECLCATCERHNRNGWNKSGNAIIEDSRSTPTTVESIEVTEFGYSLRSTRNKRKLHIDASSLSRTATPDQPAAKRRKSGYEKTKLAEQETPQPSPVDMADHTMSNPPTEEIKVALDLSTPASEQPETTSPNDIPNSSRNQVMHETKITVEVINESFKSTLSNSLPSQAIKSQPGLLHVPNHLQKLSHEALDDSDATSSAVFAVLSNISSRSPKSTPATSVSADAADAAAESSGDEEKTITHIEVTKLSSPSGRANTESRDFSSQPVVPDGNTPAESIETKIEEHNQVVVLVTNDTSHDDITHSSGNRMRAKSTASSKARQSEARESFRFSVEDNIDFLRTPGDYVKNKGLLAKPHSDWNECDNCEQRWIQENIYERRVCCPRCERHSKLYGFSWPKTERTGPQDKEIQILDHREVDRIAQTRKRWDTDEQSKDTIKKAKYSGIWKDWKPIGERGKEMKGGKRTKVKVQMTKVKVQMKSKFKGRR